VFVYNDVTNPIKADSALGKRRESERKNIIAIQKK